MVENGTQHEIEMIDKSIGEHIELVHAWIQSANSMFYSVSQFMFA